MNMGEQQFIFGMSVQQKQQYLRDQILDNHLDPEDFVKFICQFGMDEKQILDITLEELKMIVTEFRDTHNNTHNTQNTQNTHNTPQLAQEQEDQFGDFNDGEVTKTPQVEIDWSFFDQKKPDTKTVSQPPPALKSPKQQPKKRLENSQLLDLVQKQPKTTPVKLSPVVPSLLASDVYNQLFKNQESNLKIKCNRQQPNLLDTLNNVKYLVQDYVVDVNTKSYLNKLLGSKEVIYSILVEGRNKHNGLSTFSVTRKYSDFAWLRNCLSKKNPGLIIPPMPKEPDVESVASIISAKNKLNYFLEEVSKQGELKSSKFFEIFVSYSSYPEFQVFKRNNESVEKPKSVANVENPLGELECNFSEGLGPFAQLILDYSTKASGEMKRVKEITKEITMLYYNISVKFNDLSETLTKIQQYTVEISNDSKNDFIPLKKLSKTYAYLAGLFTDHSTMALKEKDKMNSLVRDYFTYEDSKIREIKTLIDKRNEFSVVYNKRSTQDIKDVSPGVFSKFSSALFGQHQQSLDTPSPNFKVLKNQYGYFNHQLLVQSLRLIDREVCSYSEHFTKYANEELSSIDEMQSYWSNVMVSLSRLNIDALM